MDQVIDNIQVEPIEPIQLVVSIVEPKQLVVVVTESSQLIQHVVEHVHVENPQFYIAQHVQVFGHFINNLRWISMFLEQATQNVTTWSGTLQELTNLRVEYEQTRQNMSKTNNHLQTCTLQLYLMQQTFKNHDKEFVTIKGQLAKDQHENQNLSNKLKKAKHVVRKNKNLQQEYIELNQFNCKIHNDLKCLQIEFVQITRDYNKMEESNMQQLNNITNLE